MIKTDKLFIPALLSLIINKFKIISINEKNRSRNLKLFNRKNIIKSSYVKYK